MQYIQNKLGIIEYGSLKDLVLGKNVTGDKLDRYIFNNNTPHHMGVKVARMFTSTSKFYPKFFTEATIAHKGGNYCTVDVPIYTWDAKGDIDYFIRITKNVQDISENSALIDNGLIGQGQKEFYIQLDTNQVSENAVLMLDNNNYTLVVTNDGVQEGLNTRYSVRIQGSDEGYGVPIELLAQDRFVTDFSSTIPEYGTPAKPGLGKYGSVIRLRNVVGKYGRQFTVDELAVRSAIRENKKVSSMPTNSNSMGGKWDFDKTDIINGAHWAFGVYDKSMQTGELAQLKSSGLMSYLEMKAEDTVLQDREAMCNFGNAMNFQTITSTTNVNSTTSQWFVAPGLRTLLKLGHYKTHNGELDTEMIQEYLHPMFLTRTDEIDRRTTFVTGELGKIQFSKMVETQASGLYNTVKGDQFISSDNTSSLINPLKFGYQFTTWVGLNGIVVTTAYNKMFDDKYYCRQPYAPNSNYQVDSARMEILDFGNTNAASDQVSLGELNKFGSPQNVTMVCVADSEYRHWRTAQLHPYYGWQGVSESNDTSSTYSRTLSGSAAIWDYTRAGAIVYVPLT